MLNFLFIGVLASVTGASAFAQSSATNLSDVHSVYLHRNNRAIVQLAGATTYSYENCLGTKSFLIKKEADGSEERLLNHVQVALNTGSKIKIAFDGCETRTTTNGRQIERLIVSAITVLGKR